jgi:hypothetical protein
MKNTINRIVLQGRVGPPTVRLSPEGPIFASTELQIDEHPDVTITVSGYGIDAAGIADTESGGMLRVLVPHAPSMKTFDRFERIFLDPEPAAPAPA